MPDYYADQVATRAAKLITDELRDICTDETVRNYVEDNSGCVSLGSYRSLVETRLGSDYVDDAWDAAMNMLREE